MEDGLRKRSKKDNYYLQRAMGVALTSEQRHKHGTVIVLRGKVISWGVNSLRNSPSICSHPKEEAGKHSEQEAIRKVRTNLNGATLYVARINNFGEGLNSKPCSACQRAINLAGIKRVVHT